MLRGGRFVKDVTKAFQKSSKPGLKVASVRALATMADRSHPAKLHGRAFYESIGSPKLILAPMVDRSEFVSSPLIKPMNMF